MQAAAEGKSPEQSGPKRSVSTATTIPATTAELAALGRKARARVPKRY